MSKSKSNRTKGAMNRTGSRGHRTGEVSLLYELLEQYDPEFLEQFRSNYTLIMRKKKALPTMFKEMIIMTYFAATWYEPGLRTHMIQALKAGATKEQILEALETISLPGGRPVIGFSLPIYKEIVENFAKRS